MYIHVYILIKFYCVIVLDAVPQSPTTRLFTIVFPIIGAVLTIVLVVVCSSIIFKGLQQSK